MPVFALDPVWSDFYAAGGFWLGVVGFVVGTIGLSVTIWQVRETKRAAIAAKDAAEQTLLESRTQFRRFLASSAHRYLAEARRAVDDGSWEMAAMRANDMADLLGQMPSTEKAVQRLTDDLRKFAQIFASKSKNPAGDVCEFQPAKWASLLIKVQKVLDRVQAPF